MSTRPDESTRWDLHYEPGVAARSVLVERSGDVTRIVVLMQGLYVPVPHWVRDLDLLALLIAPLLWVGTLLVRSCLRLPKPPRAVFEVSSEHVGMSLCDPGSGKITTFRWPRAAVIEARANRFERGLWMNVAGHTKETYLQDLPHDSIERLEVELHAALAINAGAGSARV